MKAIYVNEYQSVEGIILTNNSLILKTILNCLDNSELLKCKRVCSFWKKIADEIVCGRIMIINRNIPYEMTRKAVTEPELLLCLDFQQNQSVQFLVEFNLNYILDKSLERFELNAEEILPTNYEIKTQIAIFPSLPGIKVERFLFYSEHMQLPNEERETYLTELINIPKEELKCILWFTNDIISDFENIFPKSEIPSLILSTSESFLNFEPSKYCCLTFSGKRMNVVMLKMVDESPFNRIKSKFMNEIKKLRNCKLEPYKCLALMFSNQDCTLEIQNNILLLFKETFPNLPILLFSEMLLLDIQISNEKCEEDNQLIIESFFDLEDVAVIRIILIWIN